MRNDRESSFVGAAGKKNSGVGAVVGDEVGCMNKEFNELLGKVFKRTLPALDSKNMTSSKLKASLSAPLEALKGREGTRDVAFAASCFLHRKSIPFEGDRGPLLDAYVLKMTRNQVLNQDFLRFAADEVARLFPKGWDSRYVEYCGRALPSSGASFGTKRGDGGARCEIGRKYAQADFVKACRTGQGISMLPDRRIGIIDDSGKPRIFMVADAGMQVLGPLHHLLYDHLSRCEWLLKGEATANRFKRFVQVKDEVFVSGDYESATDNFNIHHSEFILELILRSSAIPEAIQKIALASLRAVIHHRGTAYEQTAGQSMGNLLSFPLLCLTNYLAFKMAIPRAGVPIKINGDDIVFRARLNEVLAWKRVVGLAGLTLSVGKTLILRRYFSLNSCFFRARRAAPPTLIPVIRSKSVFAPLERGDGLSLAARLRSSCKGMTGLQRDEVRTYILRRHRKSADEAGCSFNRGLRIRVTHRVLALSGFLQREIFFLSLPARVDIPRELISGVAALGPGAEKVGEIKIINRRCAEGWTQMPLSIVPKVLRPGYAASWGEHCLEYAWQCRIEPPLKKRKAAVVNFVRMGTYFQRRPFKWSLKAYKRRSWAHFKRWETGAKFLDDRRDVTRKGSETIWVPDAEKPFLLRWSDPAFRAGRKRTLSGGLGEETEGVDRDSESGRLPVKRRLQYFREAAAYDLLSDKYAAEDL